MGGADTFVGFDHTFLSEFNFALDADAASVVFKEFSDIIVISYDTSCSSVHPEKTEKLFNFYESKKGKFVADIYSYQYMKEPRVTPGMVDPLTILALFCKESVKSGVKVQMNVSPLGSRTKGCSQLDFFSEKAQKNPNAYLIK